MKTWQLLVLRCYMCTLGRIGFFAGLLRKGLERMLVRGKQNRGYHASAGFFDMDDLQ